MGGRQDDHAEKDLEESPRGSGQDAPACRCPLEEELLGRRLQWHKFGKAPTRFEATRIVDSRVAALSFFLHMFARLVVRLRPLSRQLILNLRTQYHNSPPPSFRPFTTPHTSYFSTLPYSLRAYHQHLAPPNLTSPTFNFFTRPYIFTFLLLTSCLLPHSTPFQSTSSTPTLVTSLTVIT